VSGAGSQLRTAGPIIVGNTGGLFLDQDFFQISDRGTMLGSDIIIGSRGAGTLDNGTLHATGQGSVTVEAPGELNGHGTVRAHLINNGTVAPGPAFFGDTGVQTLRVTGNYTQGPTGTLAIEVNPTVAGSLAVSKSATLAGTLALTFDPGTYAPGATYALVTAKHVLGTFGTLTESGTNNLGLLVPTLAYAPSQVTLGFTIDPLPDFASTPNQLAVATTLQQAMSTATGGDLMTVVNALNYGTPGQLQAAYTAMAGTAYTALPTVAINTLDAAAAAVFGHWDGAGPELAGARMLPATSFAGSGGWTSGNSTGRMSLTESAPVVQASEEASALWGTSGASGDVAMPTGAGFWTQGFGGNVAVTGWGDPLASGSAQTAGALMGHDFALSPRLRVGTAIGSWQSGVTMNDGTGQSAGVTTDLVAAYGQYAFGDWTLDALVGYTSDSALVARPIPFVGRTATASYTANDTIGAVQVARRMEWGGVTVAPTVGVDYVQAALPTVTEGGADSLDLTVAGQSVTSVRGIVGVRLAGPDTGGSFRWTAYINYGHEFGASALATTAMLAGSPGNPFTVTGVSAAADSWGAGVGFNWRIQENAEMRVTYDALLSAPQYSQAGAVTFDWHF